MTLIAAITCGSPGEVSDASMTPNKALYDHNEAVTYTCEIGFEKTSGDLTRMCTAIDTWSGSQPVCTGMETNCVHVFSIFSITNIYSRNLLICQGLMDLRHYSSHIARGQYVILATVLHGKSPKAHMKPVLHVSAHSVASK